MAAGSALKPKLVTSPSRMATRCVETTPLVILQRHDETARLDAVVSAKKEESRIRELDRSKAAQLAASQRRTRARVKVYRALLQEVESLRCRDPPPNSRACRPRPPSSRSKDSATPELFEAEVMCAVNPKFVDSARDFGSSKSANSRLSGRRRLQSAQKRAKSARSASTASSATFPSESKRVEAKDETEAAEEEDEEEEEEKEAEEKGAKEAREREKKKEEEEEEEDELTQVTWEFLPDTQRTEASDLLPSASRIPPEEEEEDLIPPLLLTPGRSSSRAPSSATASSRPQGANKGDANAVQTARSLDLYFYPKLLASEPPTETDERRALACRRLFADQERESARRTRQQRHAERRASRLKSEAERRRREEEAEAEAMMQARRKAHGSEQQLREEAQQPGRLRAAPQRSFLAARAALRDWSEAAGVIVPPLCPCADSAFDCDPEQCAQNCPFFRNPEGFLHALRSLLPLDDKQ